MDQVTKLPTGHRLLRSVLAAARRLNSPHSRIVDAEIQQNARLLGWLLLVTVVGVSAIILLVVIYDPDDLLDARTLVAFSAIVMSVVIHAINRLGYVRQAIVAFIAFLTIIFLATPYAGNFWDFIPFAVVPMLMAGMFFSFRHTAVLIASILVAIFVLNTLSPEEHIWERRIMWYFLIFAGGLVLTFKYHLTEIERIRRTRVEELGAQREQERLQLALEKERGEMFRTLLGTIAHDIKTPLAIINTNLYLVEKPQDAEKRQERLNNIQRQVMTLEGFTQDMLAIARLDGEPELMLSPVDVNDLLVSIERDQRAVIEQKRLAFVLDLDDSMLPVHADYDDLRRALSNLVENAINYTPDGHLVMVRTRYASPEIIVEVADTGIGINAQALPHIFDRFYRAAEAKAFTHGGSGLGLSIVRRVVEMHGGTVDVQSVHGQGSTFRIRLPSQV